MDSGDSSEGTRGKCGLSARECCIVLTPRRAIFVLGKLPDFKRNSPMLGSFTQLV